MEVKLYDYESGMEEVLRPSGSKTVLLRGSKPTRVHLEFIKDVFSVYLRSTIVVYLGSI